MALITSHHGSLFLLEWVLNQSAKNLLDWIVGWPPNWFVAWLGVCRNSNSKSRATLSLAKIWISSSCKSCFQHDLKALWCWPNSWIALDLPVLLSDRVERLCSLWSSGIFFTGHACLEFNSSGWVAVSTYDRGNSCSTNSGQLVVWSVSLMRWRQPWSRLQCGISTIFGLVSKSFWWKNGKMWTQNRLSNPSEALRSRMFRMQRLQHSLLRKLRP